MQHLNLIAALMLFLGAAACAPAYKPMYDQTNAHSFDESTGGGASEKGFKEFEKGFYAFVKAQNCVKCHGAVVNPMFAAADARAAYANAKTRVDFGAPQNSKFIAYVGNGHCGDVACSNAANSSVMQGHLQAWATAELDTADPVDPQDPGVNKFVTAAVNLPANIPTLASANPALIRFQLSQLAPNVPALANAILEIEVHMANPTTYRMNRPKIVGNSAPVSLDGIHIFIKPAAMAGLGIEDPNGAAWSVIAVTAAIAQRPATLPTTPLAATPLRTNAIFMGMQSAADAVTVVLDNVR